VWFVRHVFPLVQTTIPGARLVVAGSSPPSRVRGLDGGAVTVLPDVSPAVLAGLYQDSRVAAVPLRIGAGVKRKTVEALHHGLPVVTTSIGAQGLPGIDSFAPVTDDPRLFADAIIRLLTDDIAWQSLSRAQSAYATRHFHPDRMRESLLTAMALVPSETPAGTAGTLPIAA